MVRVFWRTRKVNHCLCVQRPRSHAAAARAFASLHKGASEKVQAKQHVATKPVLLMLPSPTSPLLLCILKFPSIGGAGSLCICVVHQLGVANQSHGYVLGARHRSWTTSGS